MTRPLLFAGAFAPILFVVALIAVAAATPGYSHALHPIDLLGVADAPHAPWWNALGFGATGLSIAAFAIGLECEAAADGAGFVTRVACKLVLLSGLAWAASGLYAMDFTDPDAEASRRHAALVSIAMLAFLPAAVFIAVGMRAKPRWHALAKLGPALAAALLLCLAFPLGELLPALADKPGYAQRVGLAFYFGWMGLAAAMALRGARAPR